MLFTVSSFSLSERIAFTEASAAERLVAWEIFWAMAVERIWTSSARASWPLGVLMTKWISPVFHHVDDVRAGLLGEFEEAGAGNALGGEAGVGAAGGVDLEAEVHEIAGDGDGAVLVEIGDGEEDVAFGGQRVEGADLGFGVGHAPIGIDAHDFAGGFHFRAEHDVDAGEAVPREDGFLHREMRRDDGFGVAEIDELVAEHDLGGELGERKRRWLCETKGTVREARGLTSMT